MCDFWQFKFLNQDCFSLRHDISCELKIRQVPQNKTQAFFLNKKFGVNFFEYSIETWAEPQLSEKC